MRINFEKWFKQQDFYTNLRFNLGDRIFDFDNHLNAYRSLHVQIAWETWQHLYAKVDELSQESTRLKYLVGEKIGHPSVRELLDAEVQRQLEEQKYSGNREFITDEDIENLIKDVLKDHDENPDKYSRNLFKQVDDLLSEIDQLKHEKSLQELEINQVTQANQEWRKQIEKLQAKVGSVEHILGCAMIGPPELFQYADMIAKALRGEDK